MDKTKYKVDTIMRYTIKNTKSYYDIRHIVNSIVNKIGSDFRFWGGMGMGKFTRGWEWKWGRDGDGEFFMGTGWGWGKFDGDGVGMGTILFTVSLSS